MRDLRIISRSTSPIPRHSPTPSCQMKERLKAQGSRLHALVNNAAISPKKPRRRAGSIPSRPMERRLEDRVPGQFLRADHAGARPYRRTGRAKGAVVNVTSIAGSRVHPFAGAAYATSKAALASLTREMAADFGPFGVRVNAISPGEIDTSILSPGTEKIVAQIPMHRLGQPEEVAKAIYFLCTDASSYVTGAELHINGGQHV